MDWCLERCGTLPQRFSASLAGNIHGVACAAQQLPPCGGSSGGSPPATPGRRRPRRPKSRSRRQGPAPGAEHSDTLSETLFQGNGRLAESAAHVFRAPKHILCARQCRIRTADPGSRAALGHPPGITARQRTQASRGRSWRWKIIVTSRSCWFLYLARRRRSSEGRERRGSTCKATTKTAGRYCGRS